MAHIYIYVYLYKYIHVYHYIYMYKYTCIQFWYVLVIFHEHPIALVNCVYYDSGGKSPTRLWIQDLGQRSKLDVGPPR